jgi:two-component system, chemotaxis family, CheB/CheR fusion protein
LKAEKKAPEIAAAAAEPAEGIVVGIGASAGGLDALERFFGALPTHPGATFVVIQHLSPDHRSMMDNLLSRYTAMPVKVAWDGAPLVPDTVMLIPPGKTLRVAARRLRLAPKPEHGLSLPIDIFFESLAEDAREHAVGIVLSGTGSDGARGVAALNASGGLVYAQSPSTAKFDGMPRSAIATGFVDAVGTAEELAVQLAQHLRSPRPRLPRDAGAENVDSSPSGWAAPAVPSAAGGAAATPLEGIFDLLLADCGIDFRDYKSPTVLRRIERRMQVLRCARLEDYRARLVSTPVERALLRRELLIPVTRFFRDPEVFDALARDVLPALLKRHPHGEPFRAWVACCATGEEAYSVAMLVAEAIARLPPGAPRPSNVKIFATDVETLNLEAASGGLFPETVEAELTPPRAAAFFVRSGTTLQVRATLRQMVIFARHNLLADPPFTRMSLVLCRNALIYFRPAAQERALRRLQYALDPGGALVLGSSETPGALHRDFTGWHPRLKIYRSLNGDRRGLGFTMLHGPGAPGAPTASQPAGRRESPGWRRGAALPAPGPAGARPTPDPTADAGADAHPEAGDDAPSGPLAAPLRPLVDEVLAVLRGARPDDLRGRIEALERELAISQNSLQATIEELETSNEELQATNEELMASNEELQSTNEELQSVNEELYTVNSEFQEKVDILNSLNADLENVSRSTGVPTLFVDDQLRVTRFTPQVARLFKLREGDTGRSLEDFAHTLDYPELFADARRTLQTGEAIEREVRSRDGEWWLARLQPYADHAHATPRAVMSFFNISSLKDSQRLQAIVDSLPQHVAVLDSQGVIVMVNAAWRSFALANGDESLGHTGPGCNYLKVCEAAAAVDSDARLAHEGIADVLAGRRPSFSLQYPCHGVRGDTVDPRWFLMHAAPVDHRGGGAVVSHANITPWVAGGPEGPRP